MARLEDYRLRKVFRPRHTSESYIFTDFLFETSGKQQLFRKPFCGSGGCWQVTSEGNLRNLKWRLRTLGQAGRLSERMRVAPRLFLFLVRSRDFFSFSISWSGTWKYPPLSQNTSSKYSLILEVSSQGVNELNSCPIIMHKKHLSNLYKTEKPFSL